MRSRWLVLAGVLVVVTIAVGLTLGRRALRALLDAPYGCGLLGGCVDTTPVVAIAVMFGFDALLIAVGVWHVLGVRLARGADAGDAATDGRGWLVTVSLLVGAGLLTRLVAPGATQFRWDEVEVAWMALGGVFGGHLPLTGMKATIDIPVLPASVYLFAPVTAVFAGGPGAPAALVVLGAIVGAGTVAVIAGFARAWFGSVRAGVGAGLFFAVGFWPVWVGRRPWQQDFVPFFTVLFLDAVLRLAVRRDGRALCWATVWLVTLVHFHYVSALLLPILLVAAWHARTAIRLPHLAMSALFAAALLAPFLLWELSSVNFLRDVRHVLALAARPAVIDGEAWTALAGLASTGGLEFWLGPVLETLHERAWFAEWLSGAGIVLAAAGFLVALARLASRRRASIDHAQWHGTAGRWPAGVLVASVVLPVVALTRHGVPVESWYLYFLLPVLAVLAGLVFDACGRVSATPFRMAVLGSAWLFLGAYLVGSALVMATVFQLVEERAPMAQFEPLGPLAAVGSEAYAAWVRSGGTDPILVGAQQRDADLVRLAIGARVPAIVFDDCKEVLGAAVGTRQVYVLLDRTPGARLIEESPAAEVAATIPRIGAPPYRVLTLPSGVVTAVSIADADRDWTDCAVRHL